MEYESEVTRTVVRPTIASRQLFIARSTPYGSSQTSRSVERTSRSSYGASSSGALALLNKPGSGGFADVKSTRDKEKREMQVYAACSGSSVSTRTSVLLTLKLIVLRVRLILWLVHVFVSIHNIKRNRVSL